MAKSKKSEEKHYKSVSPSFLHNQVVYDQKALKELFKSAEEGDEANIKLLLELVALGQVVEMTTEEAQAEELKLAEAEKAASLQEQVAELTKENTALKSAVAELEKANQALYSNVTNLSEELQAALAENESLKKLAQGGAQ
jgi:predicted RNase H-like nuclease (RuvC/YqgF family)